MDTKRTSQRKATFSIAPNPPSPTDSLPPLTNSASNSSTSPPPPSTPPPRYHSRPRYPNDLGRVPLHRRGTSQRYEPFEDLLREAGYKETRVFTPESERMAEASQDDATLDEGNGQKSSGRAVGAVVDFLSGLIPGPTLKRSTSLRQTFTTVDEAPKSDAPATPTPAGHQTASPSLLSSRQSSRRVVQRSLDPNQSSISSLEDLGGPTPGAQRHQGNAPLRRHQSTSRVAESNLYPHSNSSYASLNQHPHRYHHGHINNQSSGSSHNQSRSLYRTTSSSSNARPPLDRSPTVQPLSPLPQSSYEPRQITHTIYHPVPSRASAYLRHMASVPNMPRPSSTPAHQSLLHAQQQQSRSIFRTQSRDDDDEQLFSPLNRGDGEAEEENPPPMPKTWLETVARAVLFGGAGAFVGGPTSSNMQQRSASNPYGHYPRRSPALRQTRSVISRTQGYERDIRDDQSVRTLLPRSRSGLADHTNRRPPYLGERSVKSASSVNRNSVQPELLSKIGRSTASEGGVRKTRVVCRSAPTSRAASPVKNRKVGRTERKMTGSINNNDNDTTDRGRKNRKDCQRDAVPSLARTRVEGDDVWHRKIPRDRKAKKTNKLEDKNRYMNAWNWNGGNENDSEVSFSASEDDDDDEEEEGELDLARMLVPPKRQNSIHSLRKHLIHTHNNGVVAGESRLSRRGSSAGPVRRGSTQSSSVHDSMNSRVFRRWFPGGTVSEHGEDEDEDESEHSSGGWAVGADLQRRRVAEHEALERFLSDDAYDGDRERDGQLDNSAASEGLRSSRNGTRRGLPSAWVDPQP